MENEEYYNVFLQNGGVADWWVALDAVIEAVRRDLDLEREDAND